MIPPHPQAPALNFYPRPPRGGRQPGCRPRCRFSKISIHALREEGDQSGYCRIHRRQHFYPRPPRGGRLNHSLHREHSRKFLSTPSARRATFRCLIHTTDCIISIHALCEEGDHDAVSGGLHFLYFYPRPLRGGRLDGDSCTAQILRFLSTPSARRATNQQKFNRRSVYISIHALCEEGDFRWLSFASYV